MYERKTGRNIIIFIIMLFIISRGIMLFEAYLGKNLFSNYVVPTEYVVIDYGTWQSNTMKLPDMIKDMKPLNLNDFNKFDAGWYLQIVEKGYDKYKMNEKHPPANWVFFPLYPLTVKAVHDVLPFMDYRLIGIMLSNIFFLIALVYLYKFCFEIRGFSKDTALKALFFLLIYPASLYFSIMYTEGLFLLLSVLTIYYTYKGKYFVALVAAALSAGTRIPGFINVFLLLSTMLYQERKRFNMRLLIKAALYGLIAGIPLFIYFWYLKGLTGDFLAAIHEEFNWGRSTTFPLAAYFNYFRYPYFNAPGGWDNGLISFVISTAVFLVYIGTFVYRYFEGKISFQDIIFFIYGLLLLVIPYSTAIFMTSIVRYMMVSVPVFVYIAEAASENKLINIFYTWLFLGLNTIYVIAFINNYFFVV
ncbi:hypothetical protein ACETAC_09300 [Aceticella autotrophica]|uniref:Glycosyltransferase RgtA/B/C/D-like domain-containing protein n=1 Tax=Aceticella autotrophica TaxID=2755338 RepID=A0A975AV63_9THEO|nr:mannosyltransferase family protein [Aceticella autotrophica]QSZ27050.1 hypothetical protein ACETAC_09300 [Aceticella autotrophica]